MRLAKKAVLIYANAQRPRQLKRLPTGRHRRRQHHQVGRHLHRHAAQRVGPPHNHPIPIPENFAHLAPQVQDVVILHRLLDIFVVPYARRADVNVKNVGLPFRHTLLEHRRLLSDIHTTNFGAIRHTPLRVAGAGALDKDYLTGHLAVGGPSDTPPAPPVSGGRAFSQHLLERQPVHHIWDLPTAVFGQPPQ